QPVGRFALHIQLDAVVGFATLLFEAETARRVELAGGTECVGSLNDFGIEKRRAHVKQRSRKQDAPARRILGTDLSLACQKGRQKLIRVIYPPGPLRAQ